MSYKIKDNIDLKELKKYGYELLSEDYGYVKNVRPYQSVRILLNQEILFDNDDLTFDLDEMEEQYIQDLIKDGLVEKVDD